MKKVYRLNNSDTFFYIIVGIIIGILFLVTAYPMLLVLSSSFSSRQAVLGGKVILWPVDFGLDGYKAVFRYPDILIGYRNTLIYTILGTTLNALVTMIAAYPLARKGWYGRKAVTFIFIFTMFFSGGMIPTYIQIRSLGILNTIWAMILPGALSVYNMIIARTFIDSTIPKELFESAKIDGSSEFRCFWSIVLPLSKAIIAVLILYYAVGHWNAYFNAFLYLSKKDLFPLQLFLREILIQNQFNSDIITDPEMAQQLLGLQDTLKFSIIVVSTAPLMCLYPFAQKHFVKGIMIGSLKG